MTKQKVRHLFYLHMNDDLFLRFENALYKGEGCCYSKTTCVTAVVFIESYFVVSLTEKGWLSPFMLLLPYGCLDG
jgi:hypothetical protein